MEMCVERSGRSVAAVGAGTVGGRVRSEMFMPSTLGRARADQNLQRKETEPLRKEGRQPARRSGPAEQVVVADLTAVHQARLVGQHDRLDPAT
jgi:hypothetical protein